MKVKLKKSLENEAGFTLFELLVVILLVAVVGGISTIILVSSLRGSDRTNSVNKTRASGNYAITQMTKMIKYARSFDGVSQNGTDYATDCVSIAAVPAPLVVSAPSPHLGFFSRIANLIQGSVNLGKKEVSSVFSKLASLIPKFDSPKKSVIRQVFADNTVPYDGNSFVNDTTVGTIGWS